MYDVQFKRQLPSLGSNSDFRMAISKNAKRKTVSLIWFISYDGYMKYLYFLFSDEAVYQVNEHMSRQNYHLWG
jgi:hypothetical protein